ncbi:F-actin-capping protein subunit alpha [Teratosphaeriaceae sp. CCFEE 6253]|nr:F-actin-capping protein subunit alpha [Teratosphaeriaceae sp. CCFEE 6253]
MASKSATVSSFVQSAPPGEVDIKVLAPNEVKSLEPAFKKYNEEQYTTVKLPGTSGSTASNPQAHPLDSTHSSTIQSLLKAFSAAATEHFPTSTLGIYPSSSSQTAILLVANKYSPQNFWNGRWRSTYLLDPSSNSLSGTIKVDVHYYEDGNVRMSSSKKVEIKGTGVDGVVREIAKAENVFQEELNRAFDKLAEGSFKGLRRQLPVTRQRVEWEKIAGYRLGQDIGGGRSR